MPKPDPRALLFERIRTRPPKFVHVRGVPYTVTHEIAENPRTRTTSTSRLKSRPLAASARR